MQTTPFGSPDGINFILYKTGKVENKFPANGPFRLASFSQAPETNQIAWRTVHKARKHEPGEKETWTGQSTEGLQNKRPL
jgi:hypothetical protein